MKKIIFRTAGILMVAGILTLGMNAQPNRKGYGQQRPGTCIRAGQGMAFLNLSEEQQDALKNLRIEHQKKMTPLKNKMAELKARERTLMSEENVDIKAVNQVIDEQTQLMNKIRKQTASHRLEVKNILTEEQQVKLQQWQSMRNGPHNFAGRHPYMRRNMHRGGGFGPCGSGPCFQRPEQNM